MDAMRDPSNPDHRQMTDSKIELAKNLPGNGVPARKEVA
jgi:hypothetical protein